MKNIMLGSDVETCGDHVDADVRSNAWLSSCPVCERKGTIVHHAKPIEFWACSWCKDVFVLEELAPGEKVLSLMRGVAAV